MAQFSTRLPVLLLLLAVFSPRLCPGSKIYTERHDRSQYMESGDYAAEPVESLLRKGLIPRPPPTDVYNNEEILNKQIDVVFRTDFGPGLHLFNNTKPHFSSYDNEYMYADQPQAPSSSSSPSSSSPSSTEPGFFKVQRSPTGKLDVVYNKDYVPSKEIDSSSAHPTNERNSSSSEHDAPAHRTDSPIKGQVNENSTTEAAVSKETHQPQKAEIIYTIDSNDCIANEGEKNGKPFCTSLRNYPDKTHLEQVIKKKFTNLEIFFGEDVIIPQNISQRMNNEREVVEEFLCASRTRVIYPEAGLNKDSDWMFIVNIPKYKQGIRIEECVNEGSTCGTNHSLSLANGYTPICKQSYIYRSLVAYTNETVVRDQFKMPSCCKCVVRVG